MDIKLELTLLKELVKLEDEKGNPASFKRETKRALIKHNLLTKSGLAQIRKSPNLIYNSEILLRLKFKRKLTPAEQKKSDFYQQLIKEKEIYK